MKCPKCGKEIANDSNFCEYCGERIASPIMWVKAHVKAVFGGICAVLAVIIGLFLLSHSSNRTSSETPDLTYIEDIVWVSPIGKAIYSGYVVQDPILGYIPHSKGVAKITEGDYSGCIYDGEFNMGKMDGRAKYTLQNGDVFVGEFKDGMYDKGKYIIAASGDSFEGTFKDGKPDKGNWYDKKGNKQ